MSQVRLLQVTGPASAAGTVLGIQNPVEGASWVRVTGLGAIPSGGAMLDVLANGGAPIRLAILPDDGPGAAPPPPHNGFIVQTGANSVPRHIPPNVQVWTKQL